MLSYLTNEPFGFILNFLTVMCFTGLHEVARELESPFDNVPNDVPLNNFQAQYNEALMTMFAGFHPDAFWEVTEQLPPPTFPASSQLDSHMEFERNVQAAKQKQAKKEDGMPRQPIIVELPTMEENSDDGSAGVENVKSDAGSPQPAENDDETDLSGNSDVAADSEKRKPSNVLQPEVKSKGEPDEDEAIAIDQKVSFESR